MQSEGATVNVDEILIVTDRYKTMTIQKGFVGLTNQLKEQQSGSRLKNSTNHAPQIGQLGSNFPNWTEIFPRIGLYELLFKSIGRRPKVSITIQQLELAKAFGSR